MSLIPYGRHHIDEDDINAVTNVLRHANLSQGPEIEKFETAMADYVGAKYAVAVSSGTAALHLANLVLGITKDDTVLTTPNTFIATANAVRMVGAEPQFVDINPSTLNIDIDRLNTALSQHQNIKAISPVHFAGLPCDMQAIHDQAEKYNIAVIEDATHALGATYACGSRVGSCKYSDISIFSLHPVKTIAAGEGGVLTTNDESLYHKLKALRHHGIIKDSDSFINTELAFTDAIINPWYYEAQELGFNYRLSDIHCALAHSQLKKIEQYIQKRRELVDRYDRAFTDMQHVSIPQIEFRNRSAHHLYVLMVDFEKAGKPRCQVMNELKEKGVGTQVHYIPVYKHPYYQSNYQQDDYPVTEKYYQQALSIPLYFDLRKEGQDKVISAIHESVT